MATTTKSRTRAKAQSEDQAQSDTEPDTQTEKAPAHVEHREAVRASQREASARWNEHPPADQVDFEVDGVTTEGNAKESALEIHTAGGRLYLDSHGTIVLDQAGVVRLRKRLDAAFQAVS